MGEEEKEQVSSSLGQGKRAGKERAQKKYPLTLLGRTEVCQSPHYYKHLTEWRGGGSLVKLNLPTNPTPPHHRDKAYPQTVAESEPERRASSSLRLDSTPLPLS